MHFLLTEGNIHDCKQAETLLEPVIHKNMYVLANRAYDTDKIIEFIESASAVAIRPPKKNRKECANIIKKSIATVIRWSDFLTE